MKSTSIEKAIMSEPHYEIGREDRIGAIGRSNFLLMQIDSRAM